MQKKVSVLTPCFNGEKYLSRYFEALYNQTYKNFEIIFVDDGSKDNTKKIVEQYIKKFKKIKVSIKYIYQDNLGQAAAVNNGLKYVTGEYLIWSDSDDYYESNALQVLANELDNNQEISYVKGNPVYRDVNSLKVISRPLPIDPDKNNYFYDYLFCTKNVCCYPGIVMVRFKDFVNANKGTNIHHCAFCNKVGQNWQLILPITYSYKGKYVNKDVYNYIIRDDSSYHSIKSKRKKIVRLFNYNHILTNVLKKFDMNSKERKNLYVKIHKKYFKEGLKILLEGTVLLKIIRCIRKKNGKISE